MTSSYFPGRNPLNYQGTSVTNPPQQYEFDRAPTSYDWETFNIGDEWLDTSSSPKIWYKLVQKSRQPPPADINDRAVWLPITSQSSNDLSSLTADSSVQVNPDSSGTIFLLGGSNISTVGTTNTITFSVSDTVNHNIQVGNSSGSLSSIAPSATTGVALISQGSSADPAFGTVAVAGGGTGVTTLTGIPLASGTSPFTALTYVPPTSFTPTLAFGGASTGITYSVNAGQYMQFGSVVFFNVVLTLSNKGSATGAATIGGFPVSNAGLEENIAVGYFSDLTLSAGNTNVCLQMTGSNNFPLLQVGSATTTLTDTAFANNTNIKFIGFYVTV